MHKILVLSALLILALTLTAVAGDLPQKNGVNVQNHATDASKCLGLKTAGTVFKKSPTAAEVAAGVVDITSWFDIVFYPVADGQVEYNGVATQIEPILAPRTLLIIDKKTTRIVPSVNAIVCGM